MDFTIPEEVKQMKDLARNFVAKEILPYEQEVSEKGVVRQEILDKMKELGFYGLTIPEEYGGQGLKCFPFCIVMEELARAPKPYLHDVSTNNGIGSQGIVIDGSQAQKVKYLPDLARGKKIAAFALTEPNAGSDAAAIETTAVQTGDKFIINGRKHYITNGAKADVLTVLALTDRQKKTRGGMTAFIVEKGTPGFEVTRLQDTMAGPPLVQAELVFEDCAVPVDNVIGEVGQGYQTIMKVLDHGRLVYGALAVGLCQRLLELSLEYAKQRVQFGKPIAEQQAIQFMLADMATQTYAARMTVYNGAWRVDQGEKIPAISSMVKLFATEALGDVADKAVQIHGGMGYMKECPVERIYREARLMRIAEGTSEIQRIVISRNLLRA